MSHNYDATMVPSCTGMGTSKLEEMYQQYFVPPASEEMGLTESFPQQASAFDYSMRTYTSNSTNKK